jgi:hypothetical protein
LGQGGIVKKVEEYLQHAAECRDMARTASPSHRQQLQQMAETWEQLADARRRQLHKRTAAENVVIEFILPDTDPKERQ